MTSITATYLFDRHMEVTSSFDVQNRRCRFLNTDRQAALPREIGFGIMQQYKILNTFFSPGGLMRVW
jgi:hypothetical protein